MVPADFVPFFSVMAGVGATLFGLIFLVISIRPEIASAEHTPVMRQVQVSSAYTALLNPLVISLIAIVPHATIGTITCVMSAIGLVNTLVIAVNLLQEPLSWTKKLNRIVFILISIVVFGFEIFYAIRLLVAPGDLSALYSLTTILVVIYLYGIARAWDLVGARQFHIQDLFTPLIPKRIERIISGTPHAESGKDTSKQGD